jgi:hypothetical protein
MEFTSKHFVFNPQPDELLHCIHQLTMSGYQEENFKSVSQ